jgi:hypothetical protein
MKFNEIEIEKIRKYFKENKMYLGKYSQTLDCRFQSCNDCIFSKKTSKSPAKCLVGGTEEMINNVKNSLKEIIPEYFL